MKTSLFCVNEQKKRKSAKEMFKLKMANQVDLPVFVILPPFSRYRKSITKIKKKHELSYLLVSCFLLIVIEVE